MLNDPFVIQQAENWAYHIVNDPHTLEEKIRQMYLKALSRLPDEGEIQHALTFIREQSLSYGCNPDKQAETFQAWADLCHTLFNLKEFIFLQ